MAYADKVTTMRRMALIAESGCIYYEGVNIEGECILKEVSCCKEPIITMHEDIVDKFCGDKLRCVYQDDADEDFWVPREE